ncbi:MAG: hypothetical protein HFP78_04295 [Methylococcales symbiont of Hymedesmia sp. n. MRB-2018]|nr:MAG: hypothetical protein HFP78_04295 [Methylococcales symbiont of Hymedesmia sp. n. MRB-2018]
MNKILSLSIFLSALITGCASSPEIIDETTFVNDYPTRDRIEYVFNCIAKHGGLSGNKAFINQYACGCKIDKIAEVLTFEEFEAATTFSYLKKTPGENGSAFRDPKQSKELRTRLKEAEKHAESQCFVK